MDVKDRVNPNIKKLFAYTCFSNLFFERSIFVIFLAYKGFSIAEIALWQSIVNLSMTIGEIPTGIIADKIGKKRALMIGNLLMIAYYLSMLFSLSFAGIAIGAFMFGVGSTFISGTEEAFLYDFLDTESAKRESVKYLGWLSAIITFSISCAMFAGGLMQKVDWSLVMASGIAAQTISIVIMAFLPNITHRSDDINNIAPDFKSFLKLFRHDRFIRSIIFLLGINAGVVSSVYILAQDFFSEYGVTTEQIAFIFAVEMLLSVLVFGLVHKIQKWLGTMKSLVITLTVTLVAFVLLNIPNKFAAVVMVLLISTANNYFSTILQNAYNCHVPANVRAMAISCLCMLSSLLMSVIFLAIGAFGRHYMPFLCLLGVAGTLPLYYLIVKFKDKIIC